MTQAGWLCNHDQGEPKQVLVQGKPPAELEGPKKA